ncbi:MAG: DUF3883 domain-containing protein [Betaproteobacteria bacterium]|nr:DUF3883 domain-containing protein [Betaproteobacteria bacterium]
MKRLKSSDLSFFHTYFKTNPGSKQKGFNLDRQLIENELFPSLSEAVNSLPDRRALVTVTFFGPGSAGPHQLARKILKQEKNWRLNGELVYTPEDFPGRYDKLAPNDFAIMEFSGSSAPSSVKVVLISVASEQDSSLHAALERRYPTGSMALIGDGDLQQLTVEADPLPSHPIWDWLDQALIEDVGRGSGDAISQLNTRRPGRGLSMAELQSSKATAERIGLLGEELLDYFLEQRNLSGASSHQWASQVNAISPFDFLLEVDGQQRYADAKSTAGPFGSPVHLSIAELRFAAQPGTIYDLYRLYEVRDGYAKCRVAKDVGAKIVGLLSTLGGLPLGVKVDSLSFAPQFFDFDEQVIEIESSDEAGIHEG